MQIMAHSLNYIKVKAATTKLKHVLLHAGECHYRVYNALYIMTFPIDTVDAITRPIGTC